MKWTLLGSATVLATGFGVFVLPLLAPPVPIAAISAANAAGFNNRIAAVAAAVISLLVALAAWRANLRIHLPGEDQCAPMSRRFVLGWSFGMGFAVLMLGVLVYISGYRYLDDYGYFIEQMSKAAEYHRRLYTELEFSYGPLLFYPTLWIRGLFRHFGQPLPAAYLATLFGSEVVGAVLLGYVVRHLTIAVRLQQWIFVLVVLAMPRPGLGLNYTLLRFATPMACLLFCLRRRDLKVALPLVFVAEMVNLGLSPEIGFSFTCGALVFVVLRMLVGELRWASVGLAIVAAGGLFVALVGPGYLTMLRQFSGGAFNLIVEPQPYILFYLAAAVWLVPLGLVSCWRSGWVDASLLTSLFVSGLALLPVAFGRADPGHVLFNGLAIFLLVLVPVSAWRRRGQLLWMAGMAILLLTLQVSVISAGRFPIQRAVKAAILRYAPLDVRLAILRRHLPMDPETAAMMAEPHPAIEAADIVDRVRSVTGVAKVATPLQVSLQVESELRRQSMYVPDYYAFQTGVISESAELREIAVMNGAPWLLLPLPAFPLTTETPSSTQVAEGLAFPYPQKRTSFLLGLRANENLAQHWTPVAKIDKYTLFHRRW